MDRVARFLGAGSNRNLIYVLWCLRRNDDDTGEQLSRDQDIDSARGRIVKVRKNFKKPPDAK
jgi:hypothetical protein